MAEISGSITTLTPVNGSAVASPVSVKAAATGDIPAAEGGVQETYRVIVRINVFNYGSCDYLPGNQVSQEIEVDPDFRTSG